MPAAVLALDAKASLALDAKASVEHNKNMSIAPLSRQTPKTLPEVALTPQIGFARGRVHELCGPARRRFAVMIAAQTQGPVLWIRPAWTPEKLCADGMAAHLNPGRIVFTDVIRAPDILWCMEEATRSGAAPVVIAEMTEPPGLTPVRRLHLAAETSKVLPLLLSTGEGGAQGVESRWHMAPAHEVPQARWTVTRLRARMLPPANWTLTLLDKVLLAA